MLSIVLRYVQGKGMMYKEKVPGKAHELAVVW